MRFGASGEARLLEMVGGTDRGGLERRAADLRRRGDVLPVGPETRVGNVRQRSTHAALQPRPLVAHRTRAQLRSASTGQLRFTAGVSGTHCQT